MNTPTRTNIDERMRQLVTQKIDEHRRFRLLEEWTAIPHNTWKAWFHQRQRPTSEMIEAISRRFPEYAFWITTGITDYRFGHIGIETESTETEALRYMNEWGSKTSVVSKSHLHAVMQHFLELISGAPGLSSTYLYNLEYLIQSRLNDVVHLEKMRQMNRDAEAEQELKDTFEALSKLPRFGPDANKK